MIQQILVPVYLGNTSEEAVNHSLKLAQMFHGRVRFLFPVDPALRHYLSLNGYPAAGPAPDPQGVEESAHYLAKEALDHALELARQAGVGAEVEWVEREPTQAILEACVSLRESSEACVSLGKSNLAAPKCDLVVMGERVFPHLSRKDLDALAATLSEQQIPMLLIQPASKQYSSAAWGLAL
ncbi:MAG TPA: universal stress protein [Meiothermus sp.]|nr:universal stress protein [Meiothermus sp.]